MFRTRLIYFLILILSANTLASAQTKKNVKAKAETPSLADILYEDMLESTANILIIDSVVTDKDDFLKYIPIGKEVGCLDSYNNFMKTTDQPGAYVYVNEFGNRAFFSKTDNEGKLQLYSADKLNGQWTKSSPITDFGDEFEEINYPFMMPDGVTLYFSAINKDNLGGYDIYVTTYDADSAKFYKPENIGLPYNSKANDYYCIIDDFNSLGWLVTDRRQPEGSVCIYTFVPSTSLVINDNDDIDDNNLKDLADIKSIKDTWTDDAKLQEAKNQLNKLLQQKQDLEENYISFIVNDNTVYTKLEDFKSTTNKERFNKLCQMRESATNMSEQLDLYRQKYMSGTNDKKKLLAKEINTLEENLEKQNKYIITLEKEIRNTENLAIQNQ